MHDTAFAHGVTEDRLLGGRVKIAQPKGGYRVAVDPVLLAASVPAGPGDVVADLGCGTGAVALCLAKRISGCRVKALELEPDLAVLARRNVATNGLADFVEVIQGDVAAPPFAPESFDHVAMNPPYLAVGKATPSAERLRRVAAMEGAATLARWLEVAWSLTKAGGTVCLIHRADRLDEVIAGFAELQRGGSAVVPVWPKLGHDARRVLVRCRKRDASSFVLRPGLVLHDTSGAFAPAAEKVLRGGWALDDALASL